MSSTSTSKKSESISIWSRINNNEQPVFLYISFVVLVIGFSVSSKYFFTAGNFINIASQTALVTIMACGVALVIITGEIDLSIGSNLALSGVCASLFLIHVADNWLLGGIAGLAVGATVGLLNGLLTVKLRIPSFLVTLGTLSVFRGLSLIITGTSPVLVTNTAYWKVFAEGRLEQVSMPIFWTVFVVVVSWVLLHYGVLGRRILATGGNLAAAKYSGINTNKVKVIAFIISGVFAGLAGVIISARGHSIRPDVGQGIELDVLAAVILGGTSLFGGKGKIYGVILGSLIIGILNNGLVLLGMAPSFQLTIKGALIIAAVALGRR
jgi:ribose transport system permease protein